LFVVVLTSALAALLAPCALAAPGTGWEVTADTWPTNLKPGGSGMIPISIYNVGAADSEGTVTVTDVLPPGVTATDAGRFTQGAVSHEPELWDCTGSTVVVCTNNQSNMPTLLGGAGVPTGNPRLPGVGIAVSVAPQASGTLVNRVTVAGGGAPTTAGTTNPITISSAPAPFGPSDFDVWFSNEDGTIDTQAGSHPYSATFTTDFSLEGEDLNEPGGALVEPAGGEVRRVEVGLPPGVIGDPTAVAQCKREQFDGNETTHCPAATQVGVAAFATAGGAVESKAPVFNMVPPPGVPAEFGFIFAGVPTILDAGPRTGGDYGITARVANSPQRNVDRAIVTLWGTPSDPSHGRWRQHRCESEDCTAQTGASKPFLTLPTQCAGPQPFHLHINAWNHENVTADASVLSHDANGTPTGFTGCEHLGFGPALKVSPDTSSADTPAGLTVEVTPPVGGLSELNGLSTSDIQNTAVTLPEGLVINPGQAAGLAACQSPEAHVGNENEEAPSCPSASKVGTVQIATPLLSDKLEGNVYILQSNPPNLELLVAASADGVNLKLVGKVHLDESTGRLSSTFSGTPELPFTDFKLSFSGGAQAALDTPTQCGVYATNADFSPWSSPFVADFLTTANFGITAGAGGSSCPSSPLPFAPSMIAGATTDQAGGFTNFSLLLQRGDGQQRIEKLQFKMPPGLSGMISKVSLCGEPQAAQGTCPASAEIGHTVVASGPGPYPLVIPQPGEPAAPIYLTGPYRGAPFGLSIVVPVIAGPFDLGSIVTRASIAVDPHTTQITITTDPLPQIVKGVPTDLRTINAVVDRPGFTFNPTNCNPQSFTGTATSAQGATAAISSPFQVGSCQSLKFAPKFAVSTSGKTSRANGASLTAKLSYPSGSQGTQANITRVKVDLPKQLPSRLTTLQKACTSAQFESNPAGCPAASMIGQATVTTPLLPVPLTGPAIFVSHGGEAFPSLTMVLQGYGVTVDLVGATFISRAGITSTTFKTVPDVPFNTFTLTLPKGKFSALAANGNLCKSKLAMPTEFLAQNGLVIHQSTKISTTGCAKVKKAKRHRGKRVKRRAGANAHQRKK
jgi:hypothetical protein